MPASNIKEAIVTFRSGVSTEKMTMKASRIENGNGLISLGTDDGIVAVFPMETIQSVWFTHAVVTPEPAAMPA